MCIIFLQMKHVKDIVIAKMDATANGPPPNYSAGGCVKPLNFYDAYHFVTYHQGQKLRDILGGVKGSKFPTDKVNYHSF